MAGRGRIVSINLDLRQSRCTFLTRRKRGLSGFRSEGQLVSLDAVHRIHDQIFGQVRPGSVSPPSHEHRAGLVRLQARVPEGQAVPSRELGAPTLDSGDRAAHRAQSGAAERSVVLLHHPVRAFFELCLEIVTLLADGPSPGPVHPVIGTLDVMPTGKSRG